MGFHKSITLTNDTEDRYDHLALDSTRNVPLLDHAHHKGSNRAILTVTVFILLITVGTFIIAFRTIVVANSEDYNIEICLPNDLIHGDIRKYLTKDYRNGEFVHCAYTHKKIDLIIDNMAKVYASKVKKRLSGVLALGETISAHVVFCGSDEDNTKGTEVMFHGERSISHSEGFQLGHQRIVVLATGTYHIYSQVFYQLIPDGPGGVWTAFRNFDLSYDVSVHRITCPTHKAKKKLLNNNNIISVDRNATYFKSFFVSGTFELQAGDEISVSVTHPFYVSRIPEYNFVGIFLLG